METTTKPRTCAERIADEFASTEQIIADSMRGSMYPDADEYQEGVEVYGIRRTETVQFQLSGGGPADYVEVTHQFGEVIRVEYRFSDWFDTATLEVGKNSPVYDWAVQQLELVREFGE
jgi:hypothetical protein